MIWVSIKFEDEAGPSDYEVVSVGQHDETCVITYARNEYDLITYHTITTDSVFFKGIGGDDEPH